MHTCPVCGYSKLRRPPEDHLICPSCGTQFGYSDAGTAPIYAIHARLRAKWISRGANWSSRVVHAPPYWSPWLQLIRAGFAADMPFAAEVEVSETVDIATTGFGVKVKENDEYRELVYACSY